jgi:hypothetical protein
MNFLIRFATDRDGLGLTGAAVFKRIAAALYLERVL